MTDVQFEVVGLPSPQGSKTRMPNGAMLDGKSPGARARHKSWRTAVADTARDIAGDQPPIDGPITVNVEFRYPMPASRPKATRNAGHAPKTTAPDIDKTLRSLFDGLEAGGLIANDARISSVHATKVEVVGWTGAIVTLQWDA